MNPCIAVITYGLASTAMLALRRPVYGDFSDKLFLIGGPAGSLKLSIECAQDVFYEDLALGQQFSGEAFVMAMLAILIWIIGALFIFLTVRSKWAVGFILGLLLVWGVGTVYNFFSFGIRSI